MSLKDIVRNRWTKFAFWALLYLLWVIWLGNFWWLLGLGVIFDIFITRKVHWNFWKKRYKPGEKHSTANDWLDTIIFVIIVVPLINIFLFQAFKIPSSSMESTLLTGDHLFVSKLTYGPKLPETPLTIPFTHNTIFGKESYSTLIQNKYRRLKGFGHVKRDDYVVFGFPNGDTVLTKVPGEDYYMFCRLVGRDYAIRQYGPVKVRPMDKKDHYVKRCVAIAGDTLQVIDGKVYVNSIPQKDYPGIQNTYTVITDGGKINPKNLDRMGMNTAELYFNPQLPGYPSMPLTKDMKENVESFTNVLSVTPNIDRYPPDYDDSYLTIFPFSENFQWTRDNYGPVWIPKKGVTVKLDTLNLPLYERIISSYEGNSLEVKDGRILINGSEADSYTFRQDYYFMMGDNRHNSLDSRYWGFVPEDHIVGKPALIWFSSDQNKSFPKNIRWRRFFKFV